MKIGICGGTGLIGRNLAKDLLYGGDEVIIFSRSGKTPDSLKNFSNLKIIQTSMPESNALEGLDAIINLAGEPIVSGKWTSTHKKKIWTSRVDFTKNLVFNFQKLKKKPSIFISGSAIGYYGMYDKDDHSLTESSGQGKDYLAELCSEWEKEANVAEQLGIRTIIARIGIVLSKEGGALQQMLPAFKSFVGGPLGKGKQAMSWIHIQDIINALIYLMKNKDTSGVYNLTAPNPVNNESFSNTLGNVLSRPSFLKAPSFAIS
ncbi:MAG: TIGR01777 family oxidoreductase, partial [Leptospiraceae bacterium]|nr:TIGR01777 family oxidoreductase [Leptospiraceae bacterium]